MDGPPYLPAKPPPPPPFQPSEGTALQRKRTRRKSSFGAYGLILRRPQGRPGRGCLPRLPQEVTLTTFPSFLPSDLCLCRPFTMRGNTKTQLHARSEFERTSLLLSGDRSDEGQRIQHHLHRLLPRHALQRPPSICHLR